MDDAIYEAMCAGCPNEKRCHEECEVCDKVLALELKQEEIEREQK